MGNFGDVRAAVGKKGSDSSLEKEERRPWIRLLSSLEQENFIPAGNFIFQMLLKPT